MYTSDATIHSRSALAIEPLIGAPHGLGKVITKLLPEILIPCSLSPHTPSQRLCRPYYSPQFASFLATNIQQGMQPLPQYFPRLLSTVKMGKTDF
jgi:hypothetical protein